MGLFDLEEAAKRAQDVLGGGADEIFARGNGGLGEAFTSRAGGLGEALGSRFGLGPISFGKLGLGEAGGSPGLGPAGFSSPLGGAGDVWSAVGQSVQDNFSAVKRKQDEEFQKSHDYLAQVGQAKDAVLNAAGNAVSNAVGTLVGAGKGAVESVLHWKDTIESAAREFNVPAHILAALVDLESSGNPNAVSPVGAQGLTQLMPATARGLGVTNPFDPVQNIRGGAKYLRQQFDKYGDWGKALVAYNAGHYDPQASYNGFTADQYRQEVLNRASRYAQEAPPTVSADQQVASGSLSRPSQFDRSLTNEEALAACGPAAAVAFARAIGRNPTMREALEAAKTVGWTPQGGMNGIANQSRLLYAFGVAHEVTGVVDPNRLVQSIQSGKPVMISTSGHYFTADAVDVPSGRFHVGTSGTDLRGGSDWMTLAQMSQLMGTINGALYLR